jgi:hypothetical protein
MKTMILAVMFGTLLAGTLSAQQHPCPMITTLDVLQAQTAGGMANACYSQDKLFWNFTYTPTGIAGPASSVQANLIFQVGSGLDVHGWNFNSVWSQGTGGPAGFTIGFTIMVCPTGSACAGNVTPGIVISAADAVYAPISVGPPSGNEVVTWSNGATATLTNASPGPQPAKGDIGLGAGTVGPLSVSAVFDGTGTITQTTLRFYESQAKPFKGCTVTQGGWGAPPHGNNPGALLANSFASVFPLGVLIGDAGSPFSLHFTSAPAIRNFLPQGGPPNALTASATDPLTSSAGVFAGQVLALELNVRVYNFGSLTLVGTGTSFDGMTVGQVLAAADVALGGGALPAGFTFSSLNDLIDMLNSAFDGCVADSWASTHLK